MSNLLCNGSEKKSHFFLHFPLIYKHEVAQSKNLKKLYKIKLYREIKNAYFDKTLLTKQIRIA